MSGEAPTFAVLGIRFDSVQFHVKHYLSNTAEKDASLQVDIERRQIGDRMASDFYVKIGDVEFPFRQLASAVDHMIKYDVWD